MKLRKVMITLTERCNLDCIYCYEKNKSLATMTYDLMVNIISKILNTPDDSDICEIAFHGGEPFLEFEIMKRVCEYIWNKEWVNKYYFFATTNGTQITEEIKEWLKKNKHRFICALSLDGNKYMQDINRNNSFDSIDIDFFAKTWPEQEVKMTISNLSLPYYADGVIFMHEKGLKVSDNFAYGIDWSSEKNADILMEQLNKLMEYYLEHPEIEPSRLLDVKLDSLAFAYDDERICAIGKGMDVYDVNGNMYPCHFFEPLTVGYEMAEQSRKIDFSDLKVYADPECQECGFLKVCPTCYGANYAASGNIACRDKNMCILTKISALATARFIYKKIERNGIENISQDIMKRKALLIGIEKVQNLIAGE